MKKNFSLMKENHAVVDHAMFASFFRSSDSNRPTLTRTIFRDAFMDTESTNNLENAMSDGSIEFYSEIKNEISIDRKTLTAKRGGLRNNERSIAGCKFDFEIVLRVFESDPVESYLKLIEKGLKMIEMDTLGGSGSRGCGKVEFTYQILDKPVNTL